MARQRVDMRLDEDLLAWADEYAKERGVSRTALLEGALVSFREDAKAGVPEFRAKVSQQLYSKEVQDQLEQGVGQCPKRLPGMGHVWAGVQASGDSSNPCKFCGTAGRQARDKDGKPTGPEGYFERATRERVEVFSRTRTPDSIAGRKAKV